MCNNAHVRQTHNKSNQLRCEISFICIGKSPLDNKEHMMCLCCVSFIGWLIGSVCIDSLVGFCLIRWIFSLIVFFSLAVTISLIVFLFGCPQCWFESSLWLLPLIFSLLIHMFVCRMSSLPFESS